MQNVVSMFMSVNPSEAIAMKLGTSWYVLDVRALNYTQN